jgi:hypothetical protein
MQGVFGVSNFHVHGGPGFGTRLCPKDQPQQAQTPMKYSTRCG